MKKDASAHSTPPYAKGETKKDDGLYQRGLFLSMALNMSWQLAIVFVVPIVGGYELDQALNIAPILTIVGTVIAGLGVLAVLRQVLKQATERAGYSAVSKEEPKQK